MTVVDEIPQDAGQQDTSRQDATTAFDALIDKVRAEFDTTSVSYTHLTLPTKRIV